jgi:hypothetical protein
MVKDIARTRLAGIILALRPADPPSTIAEILCATNARGDRS